MSIKIAFVSPYDPDDKNSMSGTVHYIFKSLEKFGQVTYVHLSLMKIPFIMRFILELNKYLIKRTYFYAHSISVSRIIGKQLSEKLHKDKYDLVFGAFSSTEIAFVKTFIPVIHLSDSTFYNLIRYDPGYSDLLPLSKWEGNIIEKRVLHKATKLIYSSDWAAHSAITDYGAPPGKVHVIPFGANLDSIPASMAKTATASRQCKLLFVGKDWQFKGGEVALDTVEKLEALGIPTELTIVGCQPPGKLERRNIQVIPFLNKNLDEEARRLEQLFLQADFFILPTRADCTPIVFSEANAFGLPVIATRTGGIPTIIRDGINGYLLPQTADGTRYAEVIAGIFQDKTRYAALRQACRKEYEERLNWEAWSQQVAGVMQSVLA